MARVSKGLSRHEAVGSSPVVTNYLWTAEAKPVYHRGQLAASYPAAQSARNCTSGVLPSCIVGVPARETSYSWSFCLRCRLLITPLPSGKKKFCTVSRGFPTELIRRAEWCSIKREICTVRLPTGARMTVRELRSAALCSNCSPRCRRVEHGASTCFTYSKA